MTTNRVTDAMKHTLLTLLAIALLGTSPASARAFQQAVQVVPMAKKISIEDGRVFLNGKRVEDARLPDGLRELDENVSLTFWTTDNALIDINGQTFVFENDRFREAGPDEKAQRNVMVVFSGQSEGTNVSLFEAPEATATYQLRSRPTGEAHAMQSYVTQLRQRADEVNKLTFELKEVAPEGNELARQMVVEAENAARIASLLPRVEYESYLGSLQAENRVLYEELQRERQMEMRTHQLAMAARNADSSEEREKHIAELRNVLTEIFELKQDNRQQEIEQLEQQLNELQDRLAERESLKKDIIESRLADLLNLHRW